MDRTDTTIVVEEAPVPAPPSLFNDVHFERWEPPAPRDTTWAPFSRLPAELRRHVWLICLGRHRMIELDISPAADEESTSYPGDGSQSRYYTDRNALGNVVSGRGYVLTWSGRRQGDAACYSPLLWVNRESRRATRGFYCVHLPSFGPQRDQVLYLNPAYDVVSVHPRWERGHGTTNRFTLLADFLHDVKAYDRKGQGVAHLVLTSPGFLSPGAFTPEELLYFQLSPNTLHPAAAASFADILQRRLRSVLFDIPFKSCYRGLGCEMKPPFHFAQNLPLARRGHPAGAFHWFDADPRPGVEVDIRKLLLGNDPRDHARDWKRLEQAFGVTRPTEHQHQDQQPQQAVCGKTGAAGPRLYVCPTIRWPKYEREELRRQDELRRWHRATVGTQPQNRPAPPPPRDGDGEAGEGAEDEEGPRAVLARHLREEADDWLQTRTSISSLFRLEPPRTIPKRGLVLDDEMFERMEKLPCTAIGMWLFPAEVFNDRTYVRRSCFDASAVRPELFLFEV